MKQMGEVATDGTCEHILATPIMSQLFSSLSNQYEEGGTWRRFCVSVCISVVAFSIQTDRQMCVNHNSAFGFLEIQTFFKKPPCT